MIAMGTGAARRHGHGHRRATPAGPGLTISYSPLALAGFLALFGLCFIVPLGSKGALLFL
ncbi:hypothetical protein H5394_13445, partial [Paracoccus sp. MC1862]|nr:hypothetical protein [Paracoccus sp. MC1854]MBB1499129.1 hypothetical protein [Paracoccus sp. MC1862]